MDSLGITLIGLVTGYLLVYVVSLVFAVREVRRWHLSSSIVIICGLLIVAVPFIWPVVSYAVRRKLSAQATIRPIMQIKIGYSWFVVVGGFFAHSICRIFCRYTVRDEFADELASCCSLVSVLLVMLFGVWLHAKLNDQLMSKA